MRKPTMIRIGTALAAALAAGNLVGAPGAEAVAVDRYRIEMKAWIPHPSVAGPPPATPACGGGPVATYNGNDHVSYDGSHKALVTYEFTYSEGRWADVGYTVDFGETRASYGLCRKQAQVTSDGGVVATADGVRLYIDTANPLVPGAPPIKGSLDLRFASDAELVARHEMRKFPSQGFRLWRNGTLVATAVNFDAGCKSVSGVAGMITVGKGLRDRATPIEHHIDVRVAGQDYFGPCGQERPRPLSFPA